MDEHGGSAGLGGIMGEHHESSMADTLKHLKEMWERKFQDICQEAYQKSLLLKEKRHQQLNQQIQNNPYSDRLAH